MKLWITTVTSWDEFPRARHQVTEELIKLGHEVVFVEKNRQGAPRISVREEKPGLTVITPFCPIEFRFRYRLPVVNEIYQTWLYSWLKKRYGDTVVINFDFTAHLLHRYFERNIYYCNDEYIGNSRYRHLPTNGYHRTIERQVAEKSCFCVSTCDHLTRKLRTFNDRVYEIPLGGPPPQTTATERNFEKKDTITVGLMGAIKTGHVSPVIVNRLVQEPDFRLVLIGDVGNAFRKTLDAPERIEFKGILTGAALFREMAAFDVAVAPYDLKKINAGVTPNKLFQYLACACPAVISPIPNIIERNYPKGTVYIARDNDDFVSCIRQAYAEDCPEYANTRLKFAMANTWEKRVEILLAQLKENGLME